MYKVYPQTSSHQSTSQTSQDLPKVSSWLNQTKLESDVLPSHQISSDTFNLEGKILGLILKNGKQLKYLSLDVLGQEYTIKIGKKMRSHLSDNLQPGLTVKITGEIKISKKTGATKLKANQIILIKQPQNPPSEINAITPTQKSQPKTLPIAGKILVCGKSDCCKRGAIELCQVLAETLQNKDLDQAVKIEKTGCLKQCQAGPNVVIMPHKARYRNVKKEEIGLLIDRHFSVDSIEQIKNTQ